jgi:hypothetical protein
MEKNKMSSPRPEPQEPYIEVDTIEELMALPTDGKADGQLVWVKHPPDGQPPKCFQFQRGEPAVDLEIIVVPRWP